MITILFKVHHFVQQLCEQIGQQIKNNFNEQLFLNKQLHGT